MTTTHSKPSKPRSILPSVTKGTGMGGSSSAARALDLERIQATQPEADELLRTMPTTIRAIVETVAREYELTPNVLLIDRRTIATTARHCVYWLAIKVLDSTMSAANIAAALGRHPTTVRDGARDFFKVLKADPVLTDRMSTLLKQLKGIA